MFGAFSLYTSDFTCQKQSLLSKTAQKIFI